jgi:hypothetical protein
VYCIKAGRSESYVARETLDSVMAIVKQKAARFPVGQEVHVYRGGELIAAHRVIMRIQ